MKTILVFAPCSPHTAKFIKMIQYDVNYTLVLDETGLDIEMPIPYIKTRQRSLKGFLTIIKNLWFTEHDLVHVHSLNLTAFIVSIFARKPIIVTAWGSDVLLVPKRSKIHRLITQFILLRAYKISANSSENMKNAIYELISGSNKIVKPIHFGISQETKRVSFPKKENIIYSPRGHSDLYNIEHILIAFRFFCHSNPSWKLVISGMPDSVNTPLLKANAWDLPVIFTGFVTPKEHAQWNAKAKIVVSIPSSDALSVTIMEAIYSNCICFISDLPAYKNIVTNKINGIVGNLDFELFKNINISNMEAHNNTLSDTWTFDYNKKLFLDLYN